ncbi:MAG: hypothetical protein KDC11_05245 [Chitinophagaceae bacterium]|nr:hypothetical protein [Chitinophagaceae bacterium]
MKYWLTLALLSVLAYNVHAQEDVYGFWGIPFYKNREEVKQKASENKFLSVVEKKNKLHYLEADFASTKADIHLFFQHDTFYSAAAILGYDYAEHLMPAWQAWSEKLVNKYGPPKVKSEYLPDYVTDVRDMTQMEKALKHGEVNYEFIWYLDYYIKGHYLITILKIEDARHISLSMTGAAIHARKRKSEKIANPSDY